MTTEQRVEEWLPIAGFPKYEVSSLGRIRSHHIHNGSKNRIIKYRVNHGGYHVVGLCQNKSRKVFMVHKIVIEHFIGPKPSPEHQVAHNDGNPGNNIPSNLRWVTPKENCRDKILHGTCFFGTQNPAAKLTEANIYFIRANFKSESPKKTNSSQLAEMFNVSSATILNVVNSKTWKLVSKKDPTLYGEKDALK